MSIFQLTSLEPEATAGTIWYRPISRASSIAVFIDLAYRATLDDLRDPDVQISLGLGLEPAASIYANIYNSQPTSEK